MLLKRQSARPSPLSSAEPFSRLGRGKRGTSRREFVQGTVRSALSIAGSPIFSWAHEHFLVASSNLRVGCLPALPLALAVALEQSLFAKYALAVQTEIAANSDTLRSGLTDGKFDIVHAAVDNAVAMVENSGFNAVVIMGGEGSTNELIAQPEIHAIPDLRGTTVIVDAATTAYALQLKKILLSNGLQAERDYHIKSVGSTPVRLAAMREHKEYAASILSPPASLMAKQQGFLSLGTTQQFIGPYQGIGAFAGRGWAEQNGDLLISYIMAFVEAQRWILDSAHQGEVIQVLKKEFKLSEDLAHQAYQDWILAPGGLERDAAVDLIGFQNVLTIRAEVEHTWDGKPPNPEKYYDPSYYRAALKNLEPRK
jgi:ABC-type nitrate/sulfonate/bicarbonate transport system substrate-binding protein